MANSAFTCVKGERRLLLILRSDLYHALEGGDQNFFVMNLMANLLNPDKSLPLFHPGYKPVPSEHRLSIHKLYNMYRRSHYRLFQIAYYHFLLKQLYYKKFP